MNVLGLVIPTLDDRALLLLLKLKNFSLLKVEVEFPSGLDGLEITSLQVDPVSYRETVRINKLHDFLFALGGNGAGFIKSLNSGNLLLSQGSSFLLGKVFSKIELRVEGDGINELGNHSFFGSNLGSKLFLSDTAGNLVNIGVKFVFTKSKLVGLINRAATRKVDTDSDKVVNSRFEFSTLKTRDKFLKIGGNSSTLFNTVGNTFFLLLGERILEKVFLARHVVTFSFSGIRVDNLGTAKSAVCREKVRSGQAVNLIENDTSKLALGVEGVEVKTNVTGFEGIQSMVLTNADLIKELV